MDAQSQLAPFFGCLTRQNITWNETAPGRIEVLGDVDLRNSAVTDLPDDLVVQQSLDLTYTAIRCLPKRLHVGRSVFLDGTPITQLPEVLGLGGVLSLAESEITALPDGLRVPRDLNLSDTSIATLPKGLHVGGDLILSNTLVKTFPADLFVGQRITPPAMLSDIRAFMKFQPDVVEFLGSKSAHQHLAMRATLLPFPDLARVVMTLGPEYKLIIRRLAPDAFETDVRFCVS